MVMSNKVDIFDWISKQKGRIWKTIDKDINYFIRAEPDFLASALI